MNGIISREKTLRERFLKNNIFICEIHYAKYQLIKSMYTTIIFLFRQKSLGAYRNSGIQPN